MNKTLTQLRNIVPIRALTYEEGLRVAELQATKLILVSGIKRAGAVPGTVITNLPRVQVEQMSPHFASGSTRWSHGRWLITLNASDPPVRQRFTLAHEFKHVIDHPFVHLLYPAIGALSSHDRAEQMADYFAACLLMPRVWVARKWGDGTRDLTNLARTFEVSRAAMRYRLQALGLAEPAARCLQGVA